MRGELACSYTQQTTMTTKKYDNLNYFSAKHECYLSLLRLAKLSKCVPFECLSMLVSVPVQQHQYTNLRRNSLNYKCTIF